MSILNCRKHCEKLLLANEVDWWMVSKFQLFYHFLVTFSTPPQPFYGPFSRTTPGEPVPEENFWTLWCKGWLTEAKTPTIRLGATPSGLTSEVSKLTPRKRNCWLYWSSDLPCCLLFWVSKGQDWRTWKDQVKRHIKYIVWVVKDTPGHIFIQCSYNLVAHQLRCSRARIMHLQPLGLAEPASWQVRHLRISLT